MKSVVVCEGCSSAILYVEEACTRGLKVIVVNPPRTVKGMESYCTVFKKAVGSKVDFIDMQSEDEYWPLVEKLKKSDVIAVVAGSDYGVTYAEKLAHDMGLKGNDPKTTYQRCTKYGMYEALGKAGIRRIETAIVRSEEDIDRFWDEYDIDVAFMKQDQGTSGNGNKLCATRKEAKEHFRKLFNVANLWGQSVELLIQEFVSGTEYIVNTVTHDGKHCVTDIWRYDKVKTNTGEIIYNTTVLIMETDEVIRNMIEYAFKVLDAVGVKYGPCHNEFIVDKKGPVLIEINARPMGGNMKSAYLDECLGHHITDIGLDTYIDGPKIQEIDEAGYAYPKLRNMAGTIDVVVPYDLDADLSILDTIAKSMKTYRDCDPSIVPGMKHYVKTVDLDTSPCCIKLCGSEADVMRDLKLLEKFVFEYPDILFSDKKLRRSEHCADKDAVSACAADGIVFSENYGRLDDMYKDIADGVSKMSEGEKVFIMPNVYKHAPYGRISAEMILRAAGIELEKSMQDKEIVQGTKTS